MDNKNLLKGWGFLFVAIGVFAILWGILIGLIRIALESGVSP